MVNTQSVLCKTCYGNIQLLTCILIVLSAMSTIELRGITALFGIFLETNIIVSQDLGSLCFDVDNGRTTIYI